MKKLHKNKVPFRLHLSGSSQLGLILGRGERASPVLSEKGGFLKAGIFSILLHFTIGMALVLNLQSVFQKKIPSVYRVTIRPYAPPGAIQSVNPGGGPGGPSSSLPAEKAKPVEGPKGKATGEKIKPGQTVEKLGKGNSLQGAIKQKSNEKLAKEATETNIKDLPQISGTKTEKRRFSDSSLQEALEDIRKRAALDQIQQRVTRRGRIEKQSTEGQAAEGKTAGDPASGSSQRQPPLSSRTELGSGAGSGSGSGSASGAVSGIASEAGSGSGAGAGSEAGKGSGPGIGPGTGGYPIGGVPWGSPRSFSYIESKLNDYYSLIWAKIKAEWTLPENFQQGGMDLETTIVILIERNGKIQKSWYEKRSGNAHYDRMAMRAIVKAGPLPPIPPEFSDNTLEIAIRFYPD